MQANPPPGAPGRLAMYLKQHQALIRKVATFGAIGVVNSAVDFGVFALGYQALKLPLIAANILSWTVAASGSYVMNSTITFAAESGGKLSPASYGKFLASGLIGLVANTVTVLALSYAMPVLIAKLFAIGVSFVVNFSLSHFIVFRSTPGQPPR